MFSLKLYYIRLNHPNNRTLPKKNVSTGRAEKTNKRTPLNKYFKNVTVALFLGQKLLPKCMEQTWKNYRKRASIDRG